MENIRSKYIEFLTSPHDFISKEADRLGVSVAELCRKKNVDRSALQRWKKVRPKTISIMVALLEGLDTIEAQNTQPADVETA